MSGHFVTPASRNRCWMRPWPWLHSEEHSTADNGPEEACLHCTPRLWPQRPLQNVDLRNCGDHCGVDRRGRIRATWKRHSSVRATWTNVFFLPHFSKVGSESQLYGSSSCLGHTMERVPSHQQRDPLPHPRVRPLTPLKARPQPRSGPLPHCELKIHVTHNHGSTGSGRAYGRTQILIVLQCGTCRRPPRPRIRLCVRTARSFTC